VDGAAAGVAGTGLVVAVFAPTALAAIFRAAGEVAMAGTAGGPDGPETRADAGRVGEG